MNFKESEKYLYSLGNEVLAMKLGLENIRTLLAALGNPEKKYLKIQIAGTNGKGSTCAFLEAICLSAGIKTGMTTSPHLVSITERIKINGQEIAEKDFARYATLIRETSEKLVENGRRKTDNGRFSEQKNRQPATDNRQPALESVPTYFEQVTAIAFLAFAEAGCELAILETGLGGRFDATTAADAEIVGVTPIDFDHQKILGNTLAEIAAEKAAIIRADTKTVIAKQNAEAEKVIENVCKKLNVKPQTTDFKAEIKGVSPQGKFVVDFKTEKAEYKNVKLNLAGKFQIENAKTAIASAEILQEYFPISNENIVAGLETATHAGRLEFYKNFLFDGAHNMSGAKALREFTDEFVNQPIMMIFGAMRDKDLKEIAEIIFPAADKLILTVPANERSMSSKDLLNLAPENFDKKNIFLTESVSEAIRKAKEISAKDDLILITGSLYLVGEAQKIIK